MEISVNIKDDYLKWLHEISKETSTDKEELIKSSIIKYIQEYKLRKAIRKYTAGSVSLGKASEIAGIPKRLLMYKLQEIGIPLNLSESDFDKGMDTLTKARKMKKSSLC
jgi:predicted HTH domain antitoxin